jgi:cytochrome P450
VTRTGTADDPLWASSDGPGPRLPFSRESVAELAPLFYSVQSGARAVRVCSPVGDEAWLVTRYKDVKALFDDERLVRSHPNPDLAAKLSFSAILGGPEGNHDSENSDHARLRTAVTHAFSARRMNSLRPRIQAITDDLIDAIIRGAQPADLHAQFSLPLSVRVICELLGVPYADRDRLHDWFNGAMDPIGNGGRASLGELLHYLGELVDRKRRAPGIDFISDVACSERGLSNVDIQTMVAGLLFAGHHATVSFLDLGIVLLLCNPDQVDDLRRDPSLAAGVAEEVLRCAAPGMGVTPRYASRDIRLGDVTISAGDAVLLAFAAANHDANVFPEPDRFSARRCPNPHVAFGYGRHFCIGASLARLELQVGFATLYRRLPTLRLAVPADELRFGRAFMNSGLVTLPASWSVRKSK